MIDLNKLGKEAWNIKLKNKFNTSSTDIEFEKLEGEVKEAKEACENMNKDRDSFDDIEKRNEFALELADIVIYTMGLAEMYHIDLEQAISEKVEYNKNRVWDK